MFNFHDTLLDVHYSALAEGGPEFASVLIGSGEGGAMVFAAETREDFISKYEIEFGQLMPDRRKALRKFGILRKGMAHGFRFLAPDDNEIEDETCGILNNSTGEINLLTSTNGSTSRFFIVKNYEDDFNSYLRWITHPSPLDDVVIEIADATTPATVYATGTFTGGYVGGGLPESRTIAVSGYGNVTIYYRLGILLFDSAVVSGRLIRVVSAVYHRPVHFGADWLKFSVDDGDLSRFKVQLEELLPIALGLTPAMDIVDSFDNITFGGINLEFGGNELVF